MAIDTRNKRASCLGLNTPRRVFPNPTGSSLSSVYGRQQTGFIYAGIDTTVVAPASFSQADPAGFFTMGDGVCGIGGGDRYSNISVFAEFSFFGG